MVMDSVAISTFNFMPQEHLKHVMKEGVSVYYLVSSQWRLQLWSFPAAVELDRSAS
jgi:hypothetical protein